MSKPIYIRELRAEDLSAVVEIEERTTGTARRSYWEKRIAMSEAIRPHWTSLVAEVDHRAAGFVFGRAGEMEFGLPGTVAWIEIIGVAPVYRRMGVAGKLIEQFVSSAETHGIETIFTLVTKSNAEMDHFFARQGFTQGQMIHFQKQIKK